MQKKIFNAKRTANLRNRIFPSFFSYHGLSFDTIIYPIFAFSIFFKPLSNVWMYISPYDEPKNIELFSQKIIFLCIQLHTRCKAYCSIFMQMISIYSYILLTPVAQKMFVFLYAHAYIFQFMIFHYDNDASLQKVTILLIAKCFKMCSSYKVELFQYKQTVNVIIETTSISSA